MDTKAKEERRALFRKLTLDKINAGRKNLFKESERCF